MCWWIYSVIDAVSKTVGTDLELMLNLRLLDARALSLSLSFFVSLIVCVSRFFFFTFSHFSTTTVVPCYAASFVSSVSHTWVSCLRTTFSESDFCQLERNNGNGLPVDPNSNELFDHQCNNPTLSNELGQKIQVWVLLGCGLFLMEAYSPRLKLKFFPVDTA